MKSESNRLKEIRQEFIIGLSNNRWDKGVNKFFSEKGQIVSIFSFVGHAANTQLPL